MNTHYLVKFQDNWADEMDIAGFYIYEKTTWDELKTNIENIKTKMVFSIGTNEEINYDSGEELLNSLEVIEITSRQYNTIVKLFPDAYFGETSVFDNISYYLEQ